MAKKSTPLYRWRASQSKTLDEAANALGVDRSTFYRWEVNQVPLFRLSHVEKVTQIPKENLRPDIFGEAQ